MALGLASCNKKEAVELKFNVDTKQLEYKVNDTVTFKISGNPDQVTFYSGEQGKKYVDREGVEIEGDGKTMDLSFSTQCRYRNELAHPNSFRLYISQVFTGNYIASEIVESEWTDVTSKFTFSPSINNDVDYTASGKVSVYTLANLDKTKPVYFAFRYESKSGTIQTHPRWYVDKFDLETKAAISGDPMNMGDITSLGWTFIKMFGDIVPTYNANGLRFPSATSDKIGSSVWTVSRPVSLGAFKNIINVNRGLALKNMSTKLEEYKYVFTKAGTYKVTFIASNENIYGGNKVIKEFDIVVNP